MEDSTSRRSRRERRRRALVAALLSILLLAAPFSGCQRSFPGVPDSRVVGRFGTVRIYGDRAAREALVFLFSDAAGWDADADSTARLLAGSKVLVVGVDLREYVVNLAQSGDGCHYLISEIEGFSKELQRERGFGGYRTPILAGLGEGGTLAYAALAQSPAATVSGAAAVDPTPTLATPVALCAGATATPVGEAFSYDANAKQPGWWRSDSGAKDDAPQRLVRLVTSALGGAEGHSSDPLNALPLVEYQVDGAPNVLAVIYSGDGGWRDLDKQIGEILAQRGIPVVGVDSLRYFWERRTPQQVADDLALILRGYGARWGTARVLLVGYSFGASVLPFAINRLPADLRGAIVQTSLLGLGANAAFQFSVSEWLRTRADTTPVLPELVKLDRRSLQCFYGADEKDTLCPSVEISDAEIIRTSGGHHFDGDYASLAKRIIDGLERRGASFTR